MSSSVTNCFSSSNIPPAPPPVWLPAMRAGETDGRYVNCTPDLGAYSDSFPSVNVITLTIVRQDGRPLDTTDLGPAGPSWPNTLDSTGLIPTFGLSAPATNPGRTYYLTLTGNRTSQGRVFIRDLIMEVVPRLG